MKLFKKFLVLALSVSLFGESVFSQTSIVVRKPTGEQYWYILKQAQDAYDFGDYGQCISYAELAKNVRKNQILWEQYTLDQSQRSRAMRDAGDDLKNVMDALEKTKQTKALEIVNSYISTYGESAFGGSFSRLLSFIQLNSSYPEADYLIGRVYKIEGEVEQASRYMKKAYEASNLLSVGDMKYDILYDLADMAKNQLDSLSYASYLEKIGSGQYYTDYEKYLLDVLADDQFYTDTQYMNSMEKIISANDHKAIERFFVLYRSSSDRSLKALEGLASYYENTASIMEDPAKARIERSKALKCAALGTVVAVTRIQTILEDRVTDYHYTTIQDMLKRCAKYPDIIRWGNENGVWELFFTLADTAEDRGYAVFATDLFTTIKECCPEVYWQELASSRIRN
ncbi:MAG TPA: hypothetical protein DCM57_07010 [Treponema sp.]|jgi:hypothetical protein|nr:hypothetical protein [Treponema sp.]HBB43686.1 hypothetical protein [Treponema sp.]